MSMAAAGLFTRRLQMACMTIDLGHGRSTLVDADAFETEHTFTDFTGKLIYKCTPSSMKWYAARQRNRWYAYSKGRLGFALALHRVLVDCPAGLVVDHKDNDPLNNLLSNLRICTNKLNLINQGPKTTNRLQLKGVSKNGGSFTSMISHRVDGIRVTSYLGRYASARDAAIAYDIEAKRLFGEFAWLNFPTECHMVPPKRNDCATQVLELNGEYLSLTACAKRLGIDRHRLSRELKNGLSLIEIAASKNKSL
jgi:hypothetical protein